MKKEDLKNISDAIVMNYFSKGKYIEKIIRLLAILILGISGSVIIIYYFGWKLWLGIFLLMFGHNIDHHWPKKDIIEEQMRKQFIKDIKDNIKPSTE